MIQAFLDNPHRLVQGAANSVTYGGVAATIASRVLRSTKVANASRHERCLLRSSICLYARFYIFHLEGCLYLTIASPYRMVATTLGRDSVSQATCFSRATRTEPGASVTTALETEPSTTLQMRPYPEARSRSGPAPRRLPHDTSFGTPQRFL